MTIVRHDNVVQGSIEWHEMRRGLLTASEMKLIITPTLKVAANDKERAHLYHLMSQRIAGYVEDTFEGYAMLRGREDEVDAKIAYSNKYEPVEDVGFITNDKWGFKIGYSPDGLVSHDGSIEAKSRAHKLQIETILEHAVMQTTPCGGSRKSARVLLGSFRRGSSCRSRPRRRRSMRKASARGAGPASRYSKAMFSGLTKTREV